MVDLDYIEGWLEFQSIENFDAPVSEVEKWIYSNSVVDEKEQGPDVDDTSLVFDGLENEIENLIVLQNELEDLDISDKFDDKENNQADPHSNTIASNKLTDVRSNFSDQPKDEALKKAEIKIVDNIDEFILDEVPKHVDGFVRLKDEAIGDSICITPDMLNNTDGQITYYKNIALIADKTWLPRYPQHHRLKMKLLQSKDTKFKYHKNTTCPKSREGEDADAESTSLARNLSFHRYSRKYKSSNRIEIMCRLCRGVNWVPKTKFNFHMAMSHGILLPFDKTVQSNPIVLPMPESLFVSKSRKLFDHFVKCPKCKIWIKLGLRIDMKKTINKNGLYHNYFVHYLKTHGAL